MQTHWLEAVGIRIMAARSGKASTEEAPPPPAPARPPSDTAALDLQALAEGILARTIRPRVADVRRLAEAVLRKRKKSGKADAKKAGGKKRKLSKIPGRKRAK
jgi:hypothetical protein